MNDFEWQRQLRDLRRPQTPRRDLWTDIDHALDVAGTSARAARRPRGPWLLAASLAAVTLLAVGLAQHPAIGPGGVAGAPWKPHDPRLAGAAVELDAAQLELRQAMLQAPESPGLRRLLTRTERQQSRLRLLEHEAG
jgi:hypothetical protein